MMRHNVAPRVPMRDEYPPGEAITVYVDPNDPTRAVLLTGWSGLDIDLLDIFLWYPLMIIISLLWIIILAKLTRAYLGSVIARIRGS